jgi:hypothetical protein
MLITLRLYVSNELKNVKKDERKIIIRKTYEFRELLDV